MTLEAGSVGWATRMMGNRAPKMTGVKSTVYEPIAANVAVYAKLYSVYKTLHDAFGTTGFNGSLANVMKDLVAIRHDVRRGAK